MKFPFILVVPDSEAKYINAWSNCLSHVRKLMGGDFYLSDTSFVHCLKQMGYNYECINGNVTFRFETEEDLLAFLLKWG